MKTTPPLSPAAEHSVSIDERTFSISFANGTNVSINAGLDKVRHGYVFQKI